MALSTETTAACSIEGALPAHLVEESARAPLMLLILASIKWFAISALFGALAFVKLHAPGMLANVEFLTYGRVQPVFVDALVYGFLTNAAVAVGLFLICRLGRTTLAIPSLVTIAALFWNASLTIGLILVLAGYNSSQALFEFPKGPALAMFISFLPFALSAFLTNARRTVCQLYPSQWFVLAGFISFPWLLSSAIWMLHLNDVTAMVHPSVHQWYANGVMALWIVPVALGAIYYFVPKLANRPLYSSGLAAFAFWTYIFFAGFGGFQFTSVLPRWYPAVSSAVAVLLLIPAASNAMNWHFTLRESRASLKGDRTWRLIRLSAYAYLAVTILAAIAATPGLRNYLAFTLYVPGLFFLGALGVAGFALLGSIFYIVPRLTGVEMHKSAGLQSLLTVVGSGILIVGLILGGFIHASGLNDPSKEFMSVLRGIFPFIGLGTVAALLLLVGQLAGLSALLRNCVSCCCGGSAASASDSGRAR